MERRLVRMKDAEELMYGRVLEVMHVRQERSGCYFGFMCRILAPESQGVGNSDGFGTIFSALYTYGMDWENRERN